MDNEYCLEADQLDRSWRCGLCSGVTLISLDGSTKSALHHLRKKHRQIFNNDDNESDDDATTSTPSEDVAITSSLITTVRIDRFRWLLIRLLVVAQIALQVVTSDHFRELLTYLSPSIAKYLVSSQNTVKT